MKTNVCYQGDCLEVMKGITDKSVDMVLTDPPYGIKYQSNQRTKSDKFSILQNDDNQSRLISYPEIYRILKDNSVAIIFCSFKNYADDYNELKKYFSIKNTIIWFKGGGGIGDLKHSLLTDYEMAIVCHKGKCKIRGKRDGGVWSHKKVNPNKMVHATEKPVDLFERLIEKFSDEQQLILDCFTGSGTTGVACKNLNRNFILIEQDEKYCDIIKERVGCEIIRPENPTDCLADEFKATGKYYGEGAADKLIKLQKEKQELIKQVLDKCPKCNGRLVKTKYGMTCEDCMEDYN